MTELEFRVADPAHPAWRSPLGRALANAPEGVRDVSAHAADSALGSRAGVAGIELEGPWAEWLLRRLTDLDLGALPAIGRVVHVRALLESEWEGCYRMWFPQEYSDYLAEALLDTLEGLTP